MAFGILIHRTDSIYEDIPSERYQFPNQYLSRAKEFVDDWIIYLEPTKVRNTKGYFAVAKVMEIIRGPRREEMYLAIIKPGSYLDFGNQVPFRDSGIFRHLFEKVLQRCIDEGLVGGEGFGVGASLIPANANQTRGVDGKKGCRLS